MVEGMDEVIYYRRQTNDLTTIKKSISICAKGYGEKKVIKSTQGMPWLSEAMKDVISCDKLRGLANMN